MFSYLFYKWYLYFLNGSFQIKQLVIKVTRVFNKYEYELKYILRLNYDVSISVWFYWTHD